YQQASGQLSFAPGVTQQTVTVQVNDDVTFEADETFEVNLSNAAGATIGRAPGGGRVSNDERAAAVTDGELQTDAGNSATSFVFTVSLSNPSDQPITVDYATDEGPDTLADGAYQQVSGQVSFAPGVTQQTLTVQVNGDTKFEADETFEVNLSNAAGA